MGVIANLFKEQPKPAPATGINAVLLGPPGSGKGTQVTNFCVAHVKKLRTREKYFESSDMLQKKNKKR